MMLEYIFNNKIKQNQIVLNTTYFEVDNENTLKKIEKLNITIINNLNIEEEENENSYDIIIFYNVLNDFKKEKTKKLLKKDGKIIFINNIITNYNQFLFHPLSYLHCFFVKPIYISDFFDQIRKNELTIKDFDRIDTINVWSYPLEYFSTICEYK